jgi:HPt (histidine-containing phosphotransfer) domain-containing protein
MNNVEATPEARTQSLLAALWLRNRPLVDERLAHLDFVAAAASQGTLTDDLRETAATVAHKLAGSLGMYGYDHGTTIARQIETMLDHPAPDPALLTTLTIELRQSLVEA